jgi:hypothetical protein
MILKWVLQSSTSAVQMLYTCFTQAIQSPCTGVPAASPVLHATRLVLIRISSM